jgi:hypothetical protein
MESLTVEKKVYRSVELLVDMMDSSQADMLDE